MWVPIVGPLVGGIAGALIYDLGIHSVLVRAKRRLRALVNHAARRCGKIMEILIRTCSRVVARCAMSEMIVFAKDICGSVFFSVER